VIRKVAHWVLRPWVLLALIALGLLFVARRHRRLAAADAARRRKRQAARLD